MWGLNDRFSGPLLQEVASEFKKIINEEIFNAFNG